MLLSTADYLDDLQNNMLRNDADMRMDRCKAPEIVAEELRAFAGAAVPAGGDDRASGRCVLCEQPFSREALYGAPPPSEPSDGELRECWDVIELLREDEGASVTIYSDNPEFNGQPNSKIAVNADWTDWKDREFTGDTALIALRAAAAMRKAARHARTP